MIDTHTHLDGEEFASDRAAVIDRAKAAGVEKVFIPAIDYNSCLTTLDVCRQYEGFAYPMLGLHPEEVKADYKEELERIHTLIVSELERKTPVLAIGEVGLDYYWSREYEAEQLDAFRIQVEWSIELGLPLMIHCRKGQNEMINLLRQYRGKLKGGVFHCFTGNTQEAEQLLQFDNFVLGIGGVLTFKKSNLPTVLAASVPLNRIVLETDSPYMAPVPMRGNRNESSYVRYVLQKLSSVYGESEDSIDALTTKNALRIVNI
jgi:TatD DNase family protein